MPHVLLSTVDNKKKLYAETADELAAKAPNVPMGLLASYLEAYDVPVHMIDADVHDHSIDDLLDHIRSERPLYVCLIASGANPSASTMSMVGVIAFCRRFREQFEDSGPPLLIWGGHPSALPQRTLEETGADYVIRGEGYVTLRDFFRFLTGGKGLRSEIRGLCFLEEGSYVQNEAADLVDVDALPAVDWSRYPPSKYRAHNWHCFGALETRSPYAIVWTSFGCPYRCSFCCINNVFLKHSYRLRSMDRALAEIDVLVQRYGVRHIKILDELFVTTHPRIDALCDKLEARGYDLNLWGFARVDTVTPRILQRLKRVGFNWIAYGFESADTGVRESTRKRYSPELVEQVIGWTRDAGISICADAIFGLWEDDMDSMRRTRDFLFHNNFEFINIYPAYAFPGTALYDQYIREGVMAEPESWEGYSLYGYEGTALPTRYLTAEQVLEFRDRVFIEYYSRSEYLEMIERRFGTATRDHVRSMTQVRLKRRALGD